MVAFLSVPPPLVSSTLVPPPLVPPPLALPTPVPSRRARSIRRSRPSKPASSARSALVGTPSARAVRFAVPSGTIASGTPVPASASAQARTVPSPPAANTRLAPSASARRVSARPSSASLVGANHGFQPRSPAARRQRRRNPRGSRSSVRLTMNATTGMPHSAPPGPHTRASACLSARRPSPAGSGKMTSTASPLAALVTAQLGAVRDRAHDGQPEPQPVAGAQLRPRAQSLWSGPGQDRRPSPARAAAGVLRPGGVAVSVTVLARGQERKRVSFDCARVRHRDEAVIDGTATVIASPVRSAVHEPSGLGLAAPARRGPPYRETKGSTT